MSSIRIRLIRVVRAFFTLNVRASSRLDGVLNPDHGKLEQHFFDLAGQVMSELPNGAIVADLGGGRDCEFVKYLPSGRDLKLVAVDISADELEQNQQVTEVRVANVAEELPFADGEVGLILSRCLLEHVDGVPNAVRHMGRALKAGGSAIIYLPCRFSTFATAARVLPFGPLLKLLHWVKPETSGWIEFDVFYDHCYPAALERLFHEAGFRQVEVQVEYASTEFYSAFFPIFLAVALYERIARKLDARSLAAHFMVYAVR